MSSQSDHLNLPFIAAAQAQKHVTHNEALNILDALVHLSVKSCDREQPPLTPSNGDRYIVAPQASGAWARHENEIAVLQDGAWQFFAALTGWRAWDETLEHLKVWTGQIWRAIETQSDTDAATSGQFNNIDFLGINATADEANRLALSSSDSLFNHAGQGHQLKLNKNQAADTAALLFQDGFSGRAEFGLIGSDDLTIKVSDDGSRFEDAISIKNDTAETFIPKLKFPDYWRIFNAQTLLVTDTDNLGVVCVLNRTSHNPSNAYNVETGEFNVPRDGLYLITIHFSTHGRVRCTFDVTADEAVIGRVQAFPNNLSYMSKTFLTPLKAGAIVKLIVKFSSTVRFSGGGRLDNISIMRLGVL